jgi:hypothetical protein
VPVDKKETLIKKPFTKLNLQIIEKQREEQKYTVKNTQTK